MKKRKNHPKNSFRLRRFRGKHIKLTFVDDKRHIGDMEGQGINFIHVVNEESLRPSLFIFKHAIKMMELEEVKEAPKRKLTRREGSIRANELRKEKQKQDDSLKKVLRRKKGLAMTSNQECCPMG